MNFSEMKYRIERCNGEPARHADTEEDAISIAENWSGQKLYQGATDYVTDWKGEDGERQYGYATDYWCAKENAEREMSTPADVVIVKYYPPSITGTWRHPTGQREHKQCSP